MIAKLKRLTATSLSRNAKHGRIALVFWLCSSFSALAFEPFHVDPTQNTMVEETSDMEHLEPLHQTFGPLPEFHYLAQYWARISNDEYHYLVVLRNDSNGRYYVQQGDAPKHDLHGRPYHFRHQAEISSETASIIYEYWVNMLLETRYDRKQLPYISPATLYAFSTFIPRAGWLHGFTKTGVSTNMPPYWMSQAGEALYAFVSKSERNEAELRDLVKTDRDKFYEYMKVHDCH